MKHINFKKLSIRNFLSVGNEPVIIDFSPGLHIITGINRDKVDRRNGVGKSTIADALYFVLYGNTIRELKKDFITNNLTTGKCEVSLTMSVKDEQTTNEYKIVRLLDPSKCYIFKDDVDITRDSITNTTDYINDLILTSEDVFQNCVIMTLNSTIPFMGKKKLDKRKFIEGILNLEIFSHMIAKLRSDYNDVRRELETECTVYDEVEHSLNNYIEQKNIYNTGRSNKIEKYKIRQVDNDAEIVKIKTQLNKINDINISDVDIIIDEIKSRMNKCDRNISTINDSISQNTAKISVLNKQYNKLNIDQPVCPTCLRKIDKDDKNHLKDEQEKITKQISNLENQIAEKNIKLKDALAVRELLKNKYESKIEQKNKWKLSKQNIDNLQNRLDQLISWQQELKQDIIELNDQRTQFDTLIEESQTREKKIKTNIQQIKNHMKKLDVVKFVVSEEGVKSYIVKKILQLLNNKLSYYLKRMDSNCVMFFNEYFEEQIVDDKGKICSYFNFSGAERKNIDLACLFTFMDIRRLQGDVSFNVSMYDELFDSSLDEKGVELVVDILRERLEKYNECMYVISHRKESINFATKTEIPGDVVFLQKENGITTKGKYNPVDL